MHNTSIQNDNLLVDVISKVKYLDFQFNFDSASLPNFEKIQQLKSGLHTHNLRIIIKHYGHDTDVGRRDNYSLMSYYATVAITQWTKEALLEAIYIGLIKKLRHEASETFKFEDKFPFHEHKTKAVSIP